MHGVVTAVRPGVVGFGIASGVAGLEEHDRSDRDAGCVLGVGRPVRAVPPRRGPAVARRCADPLAGAGAHWGGEVHVGPFRTRVYRCCIAVRARLGVRKRRRVPRVIAVLAGVCDEHTSPAVGDELAVGAGDGILLGADDSRGVLAFRIGDLPGIVGQRPRDVPGVRHQAITAAVSF